MLDRESERVLGKAKRAYQGDDLEEAPEDEKHAVHHLYDIVCDLVRLGRCALFRDCVAEYALSFDLMYVPSISLRLLACFAAVLHRVALTAADLLCAGSHTRQDCDKLLRFGCRALVIAFRCRGCYWDVQSSRVAGYHLFIFRVSQGLVYKMSQVAVVRRFTECETEQKNGSVLVQQVTLYPPSHPRQAFALTKPSTQKRGAGAL